MRMQEAPEFLQPAPQNNKPPLDKVQMSRCKNTAGDPLKDLPHVSGLLMIFLTRDSCKDEDKINK